VKEKTTVTEEKGDIIPGEELMMSGEKQVKDEAAVDDTLNVQSKGDTEVVSGLTAVNETEKQGN